jgi:FdhE protein
MTTLDSLDLREAWTDLQARRPMFRDVLTAYTPLFSRWAEYVPSPAIVLRATEQECRARWARGLPLLSDASASTLRSDVETLLGTAMEWLVAFDDALVPGIRRLAEAWDRDEISMSALMPAGGRLGNGTAERVSGLSATVVGVLLQAALRPVLQAHLGPLAAHLEDGTWELGICPLCGAAPGFGDLGEGGQRRLACHLCGSAWGHSRLRCPLCGTVESKDLIRLDPGGADEGYLISACGACRAYLKEVDRRVRWNASCPLVEDWGSPHFDLVAVRAGYRRLLPTLLQLTGA